jgi:stalled ribosome rescue protein Dom34
MSLFHAVVWIDHHNAKILQFDAAHIELKKVQAHTHYTRQHGSEVRDEHEFFGEVCDDLTKIRQIVVAGSHTAHSDFRHYVTKHRPHLLVQIIGWELVDHPTEAQLVVMSHKYFVEHDVMSGIPLP